MSLFSSIVNVHGNDWPPIDIGAKCCFKNKIKHNSIFRLSENKNKNKNLQLCQWFLMFQRLSLRHCNVDRSNVQYYTIDERKDIDWKMKKKWNSLKFKNDLSCDSLWHDCWLSARVDKRLYRHIVDRAVDVEHADARKRLRVVLERVLPVLLDALLSDELLDASLILRVERIRLQSIDFLLLSTLRCVVLVHYALNRRYVAVANQRGKWRIVLKHEKKNCLFNEQTKKQVFVIYLWQNAHCMWIR